MMASKVILPLGLIWTLTRGVTMDNSFDTSVSWSPHLHDWENHLCLTDYCGSEETFSLHFKNILSIYCTK